MIRILVPITTMILLAACAPQEQQNEGDAAQTTPAVTGSNDAKQRDVSTPTIAAIDPEIQTYADKVDAAMVDYEGNGSDEDKAALVAAYIAFGDYMTYESSISPIQGKYHRALVEYRKALSARARNSGSCDGTSTPTDTALSAK